MTELPTGGAPAEPAPPARSVLTFCPAWKRGHCSGKGWCPKQHPQPGPDDRALPEVKPPAACAALRYGVAQGWILDETARRSVNIQEAVDRVTHAGQAAVALHTRGRHGGPAEGIIVEPSGMVLVLAADMVRGVLHASRVRRACPQWTIQVYTPPRAWPFSTWAVLAVMWHLAPEDAPTGTAEEIARDLRTWPADQDYPWRRPRGGLPVAPAAEGLSLAATLQRHPDKKAGHFLQTGTVPATPPDPEWRWDAGEAQPLPGPWTLPLWYLPMGTLAHATQAVKVPLTTAEGTPPGDALPPPPQRATPARKGARCGAGAGSTRPHRPHPGHTGCGTLAARSRGRAAGGGTAPDTRRPSQRWKEPPPGTPFRHPHSEQRRPARAHAVGPVQGPHARIDRTRDTRVAEPWLPAPEDGRPGEGQRLTPGAPQNGGRNPPRGRPSATPTASNAGPQGRTLWGRCRVHTPASTAPGTHGSRNPGCPLQRTGGRGRDSA